MEWSAVPGGLRRRLAALVYARDSSTPGFVCAGRPGRPCGEPIDWTLAWPDPMSRSMDHVHELQDGGDLTDPANLRAAHLGCNASKGAARMHQRKGAGQARRARMTIIVDPRCI